MRTAALLTIILPLAAALGCATSRTSNTARTAMEQMLISGAADEAIGNFDFSPLAGRAVFLDDKYLDSVDKGYVVGSIRHRLFASGARIVGKADDAEIVLEPRSGGIGTDLQESFVGIPALGVPGMAIEFPEIQLLNRSTQFGTAKLGMVAYDVKTGKALGLGGQALARSDSDNWYVLGMGPFRRGTTNAEISEVSGPTEVLPGLAIGGGGDHQCRPRVALMDGPSLPLAEGDTTWR